MSGRIGFNLPGQPAAPVQVVRAPVCPECRAGNHRNCDEVALDERTDEIVPCTCPPAFGHEPRGAEQ